MFASNLNETKNSFFVTSTSWLYTAEHRKQRFEARATARSAKSTLMIIIIYILRNTHQKAMS